ncbi:MAG: 5,6-dimethylbenzimidazole synthase [Pseudomonadota bacterium]
MQFGPDFRAGLDHLFRWRRDVRRFRPDPVDPELIIRLLSQAEMAPSVGLSQPWRWMLVESGAAQDAVRANFTDANAKALQTYSGSQRDTYARLKLEGLDTAPVHIAAFSDETTLQGSGLGASTMPEMRRYSVVCAITQLWLAARAEGLGIGWVSILDPDRLIRDLTVPDGWHFVAYLCLGFPAEDHVDPELERAGWEHRRPASVPHLIR